MACTNTSEEAGEGGAGAGGASGNACNTAANTASTIDEMATAEDLPAAAGGGTIVEGTYHLTSHSTYVGAGGMAGPLGHTRRQTIVVTSTGPSTYAVQSVFSPDGEPDERLSFAFTLQGLASASTMVAVDVTCPAPAFFAIGGFTATPTTFTLYVTDMSEVSVYTLVP